MLTQPSPLIVSSTLEEGHATMYRCRVWQRREYRKIFLAVLSVLLLRVVPAWAVLGESVESVTSDQRHLRGELHSVVRQGYSVQRISSADGTVVKEYISPDGRVFGISWQGPTAPDLAQLLGSHFAEFQTSRSAVHRRGPVVVRTDQLVVETGGHLRAFHGRAYLPGLLPNNLSEVVVR